jgi:hypothetical protein
MSFVDGAVSREAYNERIKLIAHTLQNFCVAVTIALVGRLFTIGVDALIAVSTIIAISLFATAYIRFSVISKETSVTDRMMIIIDIVGALIAVAGWLTAKVAARNRARYLASRRTHPAE